MILRLLFVNTEKNECIQSFCNIDFKQFGQDPFSSLMNKSQTFLIGSNGSLYQALLSIFLGTFQESHAVLNHQLKSPGPVYVEEFKASGPECYKPI